MLDVFFLLGSSSAVSTGIVIGVIGLVYLIMKRIVYLLYIHPVSQLPGPPVDRVPLLGNIPQLLREEGSDIFLKWATKYGRFYRSYGLGNAPRVIVSEPAILKQILTIQQYDFIKTPEGTQALGKVLGYGLLLSEGEAHKHQRKLLNPAFTVQSSKNLTPAVFKSMAPLLEHWDKELQLVQQQKETPAAIEVSRWLSLLTLDVIGLAAFGEMFGSVKNGNLEDGGDGSKLGSAYRKLFDPTFPRVLFVLQFLFPVLEDMPFERNRVVRNATNTIKNEIEALVERSIERGRRQQVSIDAKKDDGAKNSNLLSLMVNLADDQNGHGMSPKELRDQCLTFLAAGHETTAMSLSWGLWLLSQHQEFQHQLRSQLTPIFSNVDLADESTYPSYDTISALGLLDNFCKENSRLIPVVPVTSRMTAKDVTLGSYFIPKSTTVFIPIIALHQDKRIWGEDAEEFRPSRWNEDPANKVSPYEYMPFLAGGRQCIGYRFALIELKVILGLLLTKYQFFEKPGFEVKKITNITLHPSPNMTLLVKPVASQ